MRTHYVELLSKYQGQFAEANERINERNLRRLDMDRYAGHLKRAMEKGDREKEASNKTKLEAAKTNYRSLNDELLRDLPLLFEDRIQFFGPLMANVTYSFNFKIKDILIYFEIKKNQYYYALSQLFRECNTITKAIIPDITNVDRTTQHEHPRVTTDPGLSSASHKQTGSTYEESNTSTTSGNSSNRLSVTYGPPSTNNAPTQPTRPAPSAPPMNSSPRAKGLFDFNTQDPSELPFRAGDIITILKQDGDW